MILEFLWMTIDQVADIDWYQRPINREMSTLLGSVIKHPIDLSCFRAKKIYEAAA